MKSEWKKKGLSVFIIFTLIFTIFSFVPNAGAVILEITDLEPGYDQGSQIEIFADIIIENGERIPINYLKLEIIGPTLVNSTFNVNGSPISSPSWVNITLISEFNPDYGYGYGYRYYYDFGSRYGYDHNFGYGYGQNFDFGYGYGYVGVLRYRITIDSSNLDVGNYSMQLHADTGNIIHERFSSIIYSFDILAVGPVHNINTDEYFNEIQTAIDDPDTLDGHTIEVAAGIYYENVVIDKQLSIIGEERNTTIIDGQNNGTTVKIMEDNILISKFTITGGSYPNWPDYFSAINIVNRFNCTISYNNLSDNEGAGIWSDDSSQIYLLNNYVVNNNYSGFYLRDFQGYIENNILNFNSFDGIWHNGFNTQIINNTLQHNGRDGFNCMFSAGSNQISFNNVSYNVEDGIVTGNNNVVSNNFVFQNGDNGIHAQQSSGNTISYNYAANNFMNIRTYSGDYNIITFNTIIDGNYGIRTSSSDHNTVANNALDGNSINLEIYRSDYCEVNNNTIIGGGYGLSLWDHSHYNDFKDNQVTSVTRALRIRDSYENSIERNTLYSGFRGITLEIGAHNNTITNTSVEGFQTGVYIEGASKDNSIVSNYIIENTNGFYIQFGSDFNVIHHNNIINNTIQATDIGTNNFWDNAYPSGGNYWSDYTGVDLNSTPTQDVPPSDGIGDTPYTDIQGDAGAQDDYPLMAPWTPPFIGPVHNIDTDEYFNEIQAAIDDQDTLDGHTIEVAAGIYYETLDINLALTLIGEGRDMTIIDANESFEWGVWINNDGVSISGFTIRNTGPTSTGLVINSNNCSIVNNSIIDHDINIDLSSANSNVIINNLISNSRNSYGTYLYNSNNNQIYHNNFINNIDQAYEDINCANNSWDDGYPSGGNYWSDYTGVDYNSTPTQDVPPPDGIGDTPYTDIQGGSGAQDNYPLMAPWGMPEEPPSTYNLTLSSGWNLISLPLIQSNESIETVLASISGEWDYIQVYNAIDLEPWKSYSIYKPDSLNEIGILDHKIGIWLHMLNATNLTIEGAEPVSTSIPLYAGWNLVGYPTLNDTLDISDALWGTGADKVEVFDPGEPYRIREVGPSYVMRPGEGYWVHVPADTTWTIDW